MNAPDQPHTPSYTELLPEPAFAPPRAAAAAHIAATCTECMACVRQCAFLTREGTPKAIVQAGTDTPHARALAYDCNLCGLCSTLCPENSRPADLFLALRRDAVQAGEFDRKRYRIPIGYERTGNSPLFSCYTLPHGCDTVFFPGCTLPGTRPGTTRRLLEHLRTCHPAMGVVLDCCSKPSHDLGRQDHFAAMFGEMAAYLERHGVTTVLVACPNCYKTFKAYGTRFTVQTVYEFLATSEQPLTGVEQTSDDGAGTTLHDPCPMREAIATHTAVRSLLARNGIAIAEMRHNKGRTLCCGEGGAVALRTPEFAQRWGQLRAKEAGERLVLTYCAGCAGFLGRHMRTQHVLDRLFSPPSGRAGKPLRAPFTYLARLRLKRYLRSLPAAHYRERPRQIAAANGTPWFFRAALAGGIALLGWLTYVTLG